MFNLENLKRTTIGLLWAIIAVNNICQHIWFYAYILHIYIQSYICVYKGSIELQPKNENHRC